MVKTFTIAGDIDQELMHEFSEFYNGLAEGDKVFVFLCSDGGMSSYKEAILGMMEIYKDITCLVGYGCLSSAAFELFFDYTGARELTGTCCGMYHRATTSIVTDSSGKPKGTESIFSQKEIKRTHWAYAQGLMAHIGIEYKDINKITSGADVYFTCEQMKYFLETSKNKLRIISEIPE